MQVNLGNEISMGPTCPNKDTKKKTPENQQLLWQIDISNLTLKCLKHNILKDTTNIQKSLFAVLMTSDLCVWRKDQTNNIQWIYLLFYKNKSAYYNVEIKPNLTRK